MSSKKEQQPYCECVFEGKADQPIPKYPAWRYHRILDPILVNDTGEDEACRTKGYDDPGAPISANKQLQNWFWDLEDMSPKQLVVFAMDEFEVELPIDAFLETLMTAVTRLSRNSPKSKDRLVLMAHTITMNYEATQKEIARMVTMKDGIDYKAETIQEVFYG